jgi:hypothetical protein
MGQAAQGIGAHYWDYVKQFRDATDLGDLAQRMGTKIYKNPEDLLDFMQFIPWGRLANGAKTLKGQALEAIHPNAPAAFANPLTEDAVGKMIDGLSNEKIAEGNRWMAKLSEAVDKLDPAHRNVVLTAALTGGKGLNPEGMRLLNDIYHDPAYMDVRQTFKEAGEFIDGVYHYKPYQKIVATYGTAYMNAYAEAHPNAPKLKFADLYPSKKGEPQNPHYRYLFGESSKRPVPMPVYVPIALMNFVHGVLAHMQEGIGNPLDKLNLLLLMMKEKMTPAEIAEEMPKAKGIPGALYPRKESSIVPTTGPYILKGRINKGKVPTVPRMKAGPTPGRFLGSAFAMAYKAGTELNPVRAMASAVTQALEFQKLYAMLVWIEEHAGGYQPGWKPVDVAEHVNTLINRMAPHAEGKKFVGNTKVPHIDVAGVNKMPPNASDIVMLPPKVADRINRMFQNGSIMDHWICKALGTSNRFFTTSLFKLQPLFGPEMHLRTGILKWLMVTNPKDAAKMMVASGIARDPASKRIFRPAFLKSHGGYKADPEMLQPAIVEGKLGSVLKPFIWLWNKTLSLPTEWGGFWMGLHNESRAGLAVFYALPHLENASQSLKDYLNGLVSAEKLMTRMQKEVFGNAKHVALFQTWLVGMMGDYSRMAYAEHAFVRLFLPLERWMAHWFQIFKTMPDSYPYKTMMLTRLGYATNHILNQDKYGRLAVNNAQGEPERGPEGGIMRLNSFSMEPFKTTGELLSNIPEAARFLGIPIEGEFHGWRGLPAINSLIRILVELGTQEDLNTGQNFMNENPDVMRVMGKPYNVYSHKPIAWPFPAMHIPSRLMPTQMNLLQNIWADNEYASPWTLPGGTEEAKAGKRIGPKNWKVGRGITVPPGAKMTRPNANVGDWLKRLLPIQAVESRQK